MKTRTTSTAYEAGRERRPWPRPLALVAALAVVCMAVCVAPSAARADRLGLDAWVERTFRVTGTWDGEMLHASSVQLREAYDDARRIQLTGRIDTLDAARTTFDVGPLEVRWTAKTRFERVAVRDLAIGRPVRVSGELREGVLVAASIRGAEDPGRDVVQVTGVTTSAQEGDDGAVEFTVGGIVARTHRAGYNAVESLVRRQDSRRPLSLPQRELLGRPLALSGEYTLGLRDRRNYELDPTGDQTVDLESEFQLEGLYSPTETAHVFVGAKLLYAADVVRDGGRRDAQFDVERDQTWVFFDRLFGSGFGLQLGRQNFKEPREWWWDDDLDAVRVYYDRAAFHAEIGLARELAPVTFGERIEPEQQGVTRVLGTAGWLWAPRQRLEGYFLHSDDRSARGVVGSTLPSDREDESDATLTWFGLRALGSRPAGGLGTLGYWADWALVSGNEDAIEYDDVDDVSTVTGVTRRRVRGSAFDVGVSLETKLPFEPTLTFGYARGSGDDDADDDRDGAFRQTGLHNNKWRYGGVNRFRFYGEVLRPELANLSIATVSLGVPLLRNSSVELAWHRYRQVHAVDSLRDGRLDADPSGTDPDIGSALDLVLGFRDSRALDVELTLGVFEPGAAYENAARRRAWIFLFESTWNF